MYQQLGTVVQLSMSADATCRGLRSPTDGPLVMELTKGMMILVYIHLQLFFEITLHL